MICLARTDALADTSITFSITLPEEKGKGGDPPKCIFATVCRSPGDRLELWRAGATRVH